MQLAHRRRVADVGPDGLGALDEERDGVGLVHRRQVELALAGDAQRLAARRDDPQAGAAASSSASGRPRRAAAARGCRGGRGSASSPTPASRSRAASSPEAPRRSAISGTTSAASRTGRERHEDRAAVGLVGQEPGELEREPRLARAAGTDDRQQPRVAIEPAALAASKSSRSRPRKCVRRSRGGRRQPASAAGETRRRRAGTAGPARRNPSAGAGPGRAAARPRRAPPSPPRRSPDRRGRARRPGRRVDVDPDVPLGGHASGSPVCRPMRTVIGPAAERVLRRRPRPPPPPAAVGKATKNASPCVSTSTPALGAERLPQHAAGARRAPRHRPRARAPQQAGRALDVGEQERHRPRRQAPLHPASIADNRGAARHEKPRPRGAWRGVRHRGFRRHPASARRGLL